MEVGGLITSAAIVTAGQKDRVEELTPRPYSIQGERGDKLRKKSQKPLTVERRSAIIYINIVYDNIIHDDVLGKLNYPKRR